MERRRAEGRKARGRRLVSARGLAASRLGRRVSKNGRQSGRESADQRHGSPTLTSPQTNMSEPPRIDPALEFGDQQPDRPDHDFKQRFQGLQDSFYAHGPFYGSYPPQGQNASQPSADSADAALQAIATAAQQDRRASTPSSASVGATDPNAQKYVQPSATSHLAQFLHAACPTTCRRPVQLAPRNAVLPNLARCLRQPPIYRCF